jgi:ABC-type sugar transport system substrate-binding protein
MKKALSLVLAVSMILLALAGCGTAQPTGSTAPSAAPAASAAPSAAPAEAAAPAPAEKLKTGFIVMGLGSEFFQALYDEYVNAFTAAGWDATSADGNFNPATQIELIENYVAMGVDVLTIFPVDGAPVDDALKKAQEAGVKVIEMVNCGNNWDLQMLSDNKACAEYSNKQAAAWVDKTFPDAPDKSVECVVLTYYSSQTNKDQAEVAKRIEEYSPKIKLVHEYQLTDETTEAGVTAAENIFTSYPNVKLIVTPQGTVAVGVNNYLTSMSSPITDYSNIGIFTINGTGDELYNAIKASGENKAPLRGSIVTAGVQETVKDMLKAATGLTDGSIKSGTTFYAKNEVVQADTVDEILKNGTITSYTTDDLDKAIPTSFYKTK